MKRTVGFILLILFSVVVKAQKAFRTIVPQEQVVVGEAFQVQYIVEDGTVAENFITPSFPGFKIVTGPYIYFGAAPKNNQQKQSKNFVITLEPLTTGKLFIPGAIITINGKPIKSNNDFVQATTKEAAAKQSNKEQLTGNEYFLRPGEDVQEKIRQNLFLKVLVDKRSCFVGEPVLAIFKLYSRLESKSDIVKNPGFYGFTVHDMVNLADKEVATEKINGKLYDVHTIRKVELYPLQAGLFTIDAMEITNKVEFSRSAVNKKTEQEIIEGLLSSNDEGSAKANTEEFESTMSTEPVNINVKPITVNAKPASFNGAVGLFTIKAAAVKNKLSKEEGHVLEITISGKGNFVQLNAPAVQWPVGIEGFEPTVIDSLGKNISPLTGSRTYRYAFAAANPGNYTIPAISFSFFNPDSGSYKTITSSAIIVTVEKTIAATATEKIEKPKDKANGKSELLLALVALISGIGGLVWYARNKNIKASQNKIQLIEKESITLSIEDILTPATILLPGDDKDFYFSLRQAIWNFLGNRFRLSGSEMSKDKIVARMNENGITNNVTEELQLILQQCETGIFTNITMSDDKAAVLIKTKTLLEKINQSLL